LLSAYYHTEMGTRTEVLVLELIPQIKKGPFVCPKGSG